MNPELRALLRRHGGLVTRAQAAEVAATWAIERACRAGQLDRLLPGVYRDPAVAATPDLRRRAALAWLDGRGALSHTTALAVWSLHETAPDESVHVTVPTAVRLRSQPEVQVHRRSPFAPEPPHTRLRAGQLVTPIERSLVDSWPMLPAVDRRAPAIQAVNDRLTTPERIRVELDTEPKLAGRAELEPAGDLRARAGLHRCRHARVQAAGTGPARHRTVYLDVYAEEEKVNFELDGASVHRDPRQREIDLRRDALLATLGILVVRFTHRRLVYETAAVQREVLAILRTRQPTS